MTEVEGRVRGRPRNANAAAVICNATLELIVENGFNGITIRAIAERAGVGLPTIYRRWASKEELAKAAILEATRGSFDFPDTGSLRGDLIASLEMQVKLYQNTTVGRLLIMLAAESLSSPEWHSLFRSLRTRPKTSRKAVIKRAIERGELSKKTDTNLLFEMIEGVLWVRAFTGDLAISRHEIRKIVDYSLQGALDPSSDSDPSKTAFRRSAPARR